MSRAILPTAALLALALAACSGLLDPNDDGDDSDGNGRRGRLALKLTDAPLEAREVWVTLSQIDVHPTGSGWQSFAPGTLDPIDLLQLRGGRQALLEQAAVAEGKYTGIRLQVVGGHVIDLQGQRCELKVPSGKVQISARFDIVAGATTTLLLDFDAEKSVHVTRRGNRDECNLRPVITQVSVTTSGS